MSDTSILLSGIEYKVQKLITDNTALRDLVNKQSAELLQLRQELAAATEQIKTLTEKIEIKMVADTFGNKTEIEEGRKRIHALMQNIEESIALINK